MAGGFRSTPPWVLLANTEVTQGSASQGLTAAPFGQNSEGLKVRSPSRDSRAWDWGCAAVYSAKGHSLRPLVHPPWNRAQQHGATRQQMTPPLASRSGQLPELHAWGRWDGATDLGSSGRP